jgi:hypothetical protein
VLARQRGPCRHQVGRGAFEHDAAAVVARTRPQVDDSVGVHHHGMALNYHGRLTRIHQLIRRAEQLLRVGQVQAGGGSSST